MAGRAGPTAEMDYFPNVISTLLEVGLGNLAAYLAAHVLLCLVPAFFIAGAMTALIPKEAVTRFLGRNAARTVSYPAAAAANILALVYTGGVLGADLAAARFLLWLAFGIGIGLTMAMLFRADDAARDQSADTLFAGDEPGRMSRPALAFLAAWVALLLAGTLKFAFLADAILDLHLPLGDTRPWQAALDNLVPHDAARGEEGISVQGVVLIALIALIAACAWKGLKGIHEGLSAWTGASLVLIAATLLVASLAVRTGAAGLDVGITGRFVAVAI